MHLTLIHANDPQTASRVANITAYEINLVSSRVVNRHPIARSDYHVHETQFGLVAHAVAAEHRTAQRRNVETGCRFLSTSMETTSSLEQARAGMLVTPKAQAMLSTCPLGTAWMTKATSLFLSLS
jgi:hypothetical protein